MTLRYWPRFRWLRRRAVSVPRGLVAIVCLVAILVIGVWSGTRTYVIDATSGGMEIAFAGARAGEGSSISENAWQLRDVTVCRLRPIPDLRAASDLDGPCAETLFTVDLHDELTVQWPTGTRVAVEAGTRRGLVIRVLETTSPTYPRDTVFVVPPATWSTRGPLVFAGTALLGGEPRPGIDTLLREGRWEARQSSYASMLFREGTDVIKSGDLIRGSRVSLRNRDSPALVYGYLSPAPETGKLDVVMVSEPADVSLDVAQYGAARPIVLEPDLIDLILANPVLVALAVILALTEPMLSLLALFGVIAPARSGPSMAMSPAANVEGCEPDLHRNPRLDPES